MPNPFPSMNPWREDPAWFPNLHHLMISATNRQLKPRLSPRGYLVKIGERIWVTESGRSIYPDLSLVQRPATRQQRLPQAGIEADEPVYVKMLDSEITQPFIEIIDAAGGHLVTGIEFLSPANKARGRGRTLYRKKQQELLAAGANLVEIDLLREGKFALALSQHSVDSAWNASYFVCVARAAQRDEFEVYPVALGQRLPRVRVPLKAGEPDVVLDLQIVVDQAYDEGPFAEEIDYAKPPYGRMRDADLARFRTLLAQQSDR